MSGVFELKDDVSSHVRDLISQILNTDPSMRPSTDEILAHPWMADAKDVIDIFSDNEKQRIHSEFTFVDG